MNDYNTNADVTVFTLRPGNQLSLYFRKLTSSGYSYGTRTLTCICYPYGILTILIRVKDWLEKVSFYLGLGVSLYKLKPKILSYQSRIL